MSQRVEIGFVDTPSKFADSVASLDSSVQKLDAAIRASSTAPRVNAPWRAQWNAYVRRWELERDSYADWGSRLFLTTANARLDSFRRNYLWWASDFELRGGKIPRKQAAPVSDFSASAVPSQLWWIVGAAGVAYALSKGLRR